MKSKYNYCNFLFVRLIEDIEIYKLNYRLFEVTKKEYENTEITITVFMSAEIEIRRKKQTLDAFLDRIIIELIDLELITNHSINYILPVY